MVLYCVAMNRELFREYVSPSFLDTSHISKPYADFKILTMGITCDLGVKINHHLVFKHFEFDKNGLIFIESSNEIRKLSGYYHPKIYKRIKDIQCPNVKSMKKRTKKSDNNSFNNQVALFLECDEQKITHIKIFKNSALQLCGIHDITHYNQCMTYIVDKLRERKVMTNLYRKLEFSEIGCDLETALKKGVVMDEVPYKVEELERDYYRVYSGFAPDNYYFIRRTKHGYLVSHHIPPFFTGDLTFRNFQINLITATIRLNFTLNNEQLFKLIHQHRKDLHTEYDSTRNKSFRITKSIATANGGTRDLLFFIFDNGKIIFTGATTTAEIEEGFEFVTSLLHQFRPLILKPNIRTLYRQFLELKSAASSQQ